MRSFTIVSHIITDGSGPLLIADLSHNHLGCLELAREMVRLAASAGAGAVKFQCRGHSTYTGLREAGQAGYADLRERREFGENEYAVLRHQASAHGVVFVVTAFDFESADFVARLHPDVIKIASGDVTNPPLLRHVAAIGKPMIVSTGGATEADVRMAHDTLRDVDAEFCLLHCTSEYPTRPEHMNLRAIETYRRLFPDTVIGLSSHHPGVLLEPVAFALGARLFEKHFTVTPAIGTGEHAFALTPTSLRDLREALTTGRLALGDGEKRLLPTEALAVIRLGKHLAAAHDLPAGHVLTEADLTVRAPGNGIPPNQAEWLIGLVLSKPVAGGEALTWRNMAARPARETDRADWPDVELAL